MDRRQFVTGAAMIALAPAIPAAAAPPYPILPALPPYDEGWVLRWHHKIAENMGKRHISPHFDWCATWRKCILAFREPDAIARLNAIADEHPLFREGILEMAEQRLAGQHYDLEPVRRILHGMYSPAYQLELADKSRRTY